MALCQNLWSSNASVSISEAAKVEWLKTTCTLPPPARVNEVNILLAIYLSSRIALDDCAAV